MIRRVAILVGVLLCIIVVPLNAQDDVEDEYTIHVVQRGENLFRIAYNYGLTTEVLASLNGIDNPANIQVGQRLLVPGNAVVQQTELLPEVPDADSIPDNSASDSESSESEVRAVLSPDAVGDFVLHTVLSGETLFQIATSYGVDVSELATANSILDPTLIYAGQQLIIPGAVPVNFISDLPAVVSRFVVLPEVFMEGKTGQISIRTTGATQLTGQFLDQDLRVISIDNSTQHFVFIGVPVFTEPGIYTLTVNITDSAANVFSVVAEVQVIAGIYGREVIDLLEGRDDLLNENVETAELDLLRSATLTITPERYLDGAMGLPAAAAITSGYGTRRSYNGSDFDRYHSGTDFAGAPGSAIFAPAPGRVILADSLNIRGNATMIDHGWGIVTGYWHQTEIYVTPGEFVETGQIIGTIGSTGRVTGAHLHWELWVNGVPVDPMQWVQQPFLTFTGQQVDL